MEEDSTDYHIMWRLWIYQRHALTVNLLNLLALDAGSKW